MAYFQDNSDYLAFRNTTSFTSGLHKCQEGALLAVYAHFTASRHPAIVSMPTGSGKTEAMIGLSFVLRANRVLFVEPSTVLRRQTADRFCESSY